MAGEQLYGFSAEHAAPLLRVAKERLASPQKKTKTKYPDPLTTNLRAYVVEPLEEITAASTDSSGFIIAGFGDCWIMQRDQSDDSIDYRTDSAGRRVEVTVFNLLDEAISDSLGSGSGSGSSPGPLYFATQDMFGDLWITDRYDFDSSVNRNCWHGYNSAVLATAVQTTLTIDTEFADSVEGDIWSLSSNELTISKTGRFDVTGKIHVTWTNTPSGTPQFNGDLAALFMQRWNGSSWVPVRGTLAQALLCFSNANAADVYSDEATALFNLPTLNVTSGDKFRLRVTGLTNNLGGASATYKNDAGGITEGCQWIWHEL